MKIFSKRRTIGVIAVSVIAITFCFNSIQNVQAKKPNNDNIKYAVNYQKVGNDKGHVVLVNEKQAVWLLKDQTGDRAKIIADKLNAYLNNPNDPKTANTIKPFKEGEYTVVRGDNKVLFTADKATAKAFGVSPHELAFVWANDTRRALDLPPLKHDYSSVVSRGGSNIDFQRRYLGRTFYGLASWYGTFFHGQTSSDGSRYNKYEFTAASKTLPFGTLVKVTNLNNNQSCVVRITDRGPYVGERIIDLSRRSAQEIGMLAKGVAKVKLEIVGKY